MKISIEARPQEIAELLRAIESSQEQSKIKGDLTIDGNKVFCGNIDTQKLASQLHQEFEGIRHRSNRK